MKTIRAKKIISKAKNNFWFAYDYNMNIYRGCSHGCIYCDSRSECYQENDFNTVKVKEDALLLIRNELLKKKKTGVIGTGSMSDPYNPLEKDLMLTRKALEIINAHSFGVAIATKGTLITRDIDILKNISYHSPVICKITITAADDKLSKIIEPRAPTTSERFKAIKTLRENGIYAGILLMPVLPYINDNMTNLMRIIEKANKSDARFIYPTFGVTMRDRQRDYLFDELDRNFPGIKDKYMKEYKNKYNCISPKARELYKALQINCERNNILYKMKDIVYDYKNREVLKQLDFFS